MSPTHHELAFKYFNFVNRAVFTLQFLLARLISLLEFLAAVLSIRNVAGSELHRQCASA